MDDNLKALIKFQLKCQNGDFNPPKQDDANSFRSAMHGHLLELEGDEAKRLKKKAKLHYLMTAVDNKLERTTAIVRYGTPIKELLISDLPSPIAESTNMNSLPHKFTFRELKPKLKPTDPDEFNEVCCFQEKIFI